MQYNMTGKSPGRELAIETLIDGEPQGALYRASRVLVRRGNNYGSGAICCWFSSDLFPRNYRRKLFQVLLPVEPI